METKTLCKSTDVLVPKRFAPSTMPTLAAFNASAQGSSVPGYLAVEIVRERIAGVDASFFATDVAPSAAGRSPI
ncbi:hypothetical protein [Calidifontibacter indicus]|uniref:hypothetical protein n=1 Tax=Calidifontibacter indicus TaxID=419650 RepID=UPI003D76401B